MNYPGCFIGVYKSAWKLPNQTLLFTNCQNGCLYVVLDPFECLCLFCHFGLGNQTRNRKWVWRQQKEVCLWWPYRLDCIYQMLLFCYKGMFQMRQWLLILLFLFLKFVKLHNWIDCFININALIPGFCYEGMSHNAIFKLIFDRELFLAVL